MIQKEKIKEAAVYYENFIRMILTGRIGYLCLKEAPEIRLEVSLLF